MAALAGHVVLSTALVRSLPDRAPVLLHILSVAGMVAVLGVAVLVVSDRGGRPFWIAVSVLYGGAVVFLFLFSAVYKSISLEVLCALNDARQHGLAIAVIAQKFVLPRFVERVELLIDHGLVLSTKDGYSLTERGQRAARQLRAVQRFAGIKQSGLYGRD